MSIILISIIYIAFIGLGLPDSLLGSAWSAMYNDLSVSISFMGIITMIISMGTVLSSLLSDKLIRKLGTGRVTSISVMLTAIALLGFSFSHKFISLCLWAIPYGLGAGAVDAALNNYVATNYSSKHMSWLHCFWGFGTIISPFIMSVCLKQDSNWNRGYFIVALIQIVITFILFFSLPLWKKNNEQDETEEKKGKALNEILKINGVILILITFFGYCALESTAGYWASSYFVNVKNISTDIAARFASLFYIGITVGRLICGFIANKIGDKNFIRIGLILMLIGMTMLIIPFSSNNVALAGLIVIGLGCAPVYPSIIHATPYNFGKENSQAIIGIQMASAYVGTTFMPMIFGFISKKVGLSLYPLYMMIFVVLMFIMSEKLNKMKNNNIKQRE